MRAVAAEPTPRVVSDRWDAHPLGRALRCVRCLDSEPLRRKSDGPVPLWICRRCGAVYKHWEGMPVVLKKEAIKSEEVYSDAHAVPFRYLRQRNETPSAAAVAIQEITPPETPASTPFISRGAGAAVYGVTS